MLSNIPDNFINHVNPIPQNLINGNIFFVGCWNHKGSNNQCMKDVIADIKSKHDKTPYDRGVILGDNIYPMYNDSGDVNINGGKKGKWFVASDMKYGIKEFNSINVPLDIVLGNHDIENYDILKIQTIDTVNSSDGWRFKSNLSTAIYKLHPPDDKQISIKKPLVVRMILIDTNVIQNYNPRRVSKLPKSAYTKFDRLIKNKKHSVLFETNPEVYYHKLSMMLDPNNNKDVNLIIIAGHHPLYSVKYKSTRYGELKSKTIKMQFLEDLMMKSKQLKNNKTSVIYICADTHTYINSTIADQDTEIHQIIAGTGGADPDVYPNVIPDTPIPVSEYKDILMNVHAVENSYGYCSIDFSYIFNYDQSKRFSWSDAIIYHHDKKNSYDRKCFAQIHRIRHNNDVNIKPKIGEKLYAFNRFMYKKLKHNRH
jgi:hypothetical protein